MRIEFIENKFETAFTLHPDTTAEMSQLLRMMRNTLQQPPYMYMSFSTDQPWAYISLQKKKETTQDNSLSSKSK